MPFARPFYQNKENLRHIPQKSSTFLIVATKNEKIEKFAK